ncbi:hypothetical protein [Streptomyces sp. NPDC048419]|uniref:hypothetical protein n=1 Tax=Streptomyces sp. NPDC048419 TaxID=3365547 RepID=UPI00371FBFB1
MAAALQAVLQGVPLGIALPAALLVPLLMEHATDRLDARARANLQLVTAEAACHVLQRLAVVHTGLVQAAARHDRHALRRAVKIGHHVLFDSAELLQDDAHPGALSGELIARNRLMLHLADRAARTITPTKSSTPPRWPHRTGRRQAVGAPAPGLRKSSQPAIEPSPAT